MTFSKFAKQVKGIKTLEEFKEYEKAINEYVEDIHWNVQAFPKRHTLGSGMWRNTGEILPNTDERPYLIEGLKKKGYEFRECGDEWRF